MKTWRELTDHEKIERTASAGAIYALLITVTLFIAVLALIVALTK